MEITSADAFPSELPPVRSPDPDAPPAAEDVMPVEDSGDIVTIDVLVAYTPAAVRYVGSEAGIVSQVALAAAEANGGFEASRVRQRIRVVETVPVQYAEPSADTFGRALKALTSADDGKMDELHEARRRTRADAVVLFLGSTAACGLAHFIAAPSSSSADRAFAVVSTKCATGYYSFAHELGHLQGADHDRAAASHGDPKGEGFCYRDPSSRFRTIGAYPCGVPAAACTRVNFWSNPEVVYRGVRLGVAAGDPAAANNAGQLNRTRHAVQSWGDSLSTTVDVDSSI